ncbi:hypothetical protein J6590_024765 [Homalodisca vitripennis]|nr:hypothetical protein J6590_024765 [Homalodisca vitripennis]
MELPRAKDTHSHNTRRATDYLLPGHHTTRYSRKPSYMGRKIFNTLPLNLKNLGGNEFKKSLQDWLVDRPFYTMTEFFDSTRHWYGSGRLGWSTPAKSATAIDNMISNIENVVVSVLCMGIADHDAQIADIDSLTPLCHLSELKLRRDMKRCNIAHLKFLFGKEKWDFLNEPISSERITFFLS